MSAAQIIEIFRAYQIGGWTAQSLALRFGVDRRLIHWAIDEAQRRRRRLAVAHG
jgi:ribosomal protein S9